jgi:glycolate oxidase iron-sulfur subunit
MSSLKPFPADLADRCVKCGLCLPHCPTYQLTGIEGESPRGRIALMQGLASGRLDASAGLVQHLENCLGCRACESVCPAEVPYGELIDAGRALLVEQGVRPRAARRMLGMLMRRPRLLALAVGLARMPGMAALARRVGGLAGRAAALLPADARAPRTTAEAPSVGARRGEVLLFAGCVGAAVGGCSLDDTRRALESAGWRVRMPTRQRCCGAIDLHAGRPAAARVLALRNLAAFPGEAPVVVCASGCAATLTEYGRLAGAPGARFSRRIMDPAELLVDAPLALTAGRFRTVVLHVPCTQRNVTGTAAATRRLLARIPGLAVRELPAGCCGAAGEMFLSNPALSDALLTPLLAELARDVPDALITSNIGCAMHFAAGFKRAGLAVPVLHPASLVVGALE